MIARHDPWSIETEQYLLGACICDSVHIDFLASEIESADWYDPLHRRIWDCILSLRANGPVNLHILANALKADSGLAEIGHDYLDSLRASGLALPAISDLKPVLKQYCAILKDLSGRRAIIQIGERLVDGGFSSPSETLLQKAIDGAADGLLSLGETGTRKSESLSTVATRVLGRAESHLHGDRPESVPTGLEKLQRAFGGLQAGDFLALCGRSASGKTAVLRKLCLSAAMAGKPCLLFSLEMTSDQIVQSILCDIDFHIKEQGQPPIEYWKFRVGALSNFEIERLARAKAHLDGIPLEICDDSAISMTGIAARARAFKNRHKTKLGIIAVDFLQLVEDDTRSKSDNREQVVSRLAYAHKRLAKQLEWPVVAAVQLKNKSDGRGPVDKLPNEEDIRESGAVLMASDIAVAIHRKALFHKQKEPENKHTAEWEEWSIEMRILEHEMLLRGFKNRHGNPSALNVSLWCDLAIGTILDERPTRPYQPYPIQYEAS